MSRAQVVFMQLAVALTALTGAVFAWMRYGMTSDDPFAVANHPAQPFVLDAHVVVAPLLVFAFGWIFGNHIAPGFQNRNARKRPSGWWSGVMIAPMILSGYLIQVTTSEPVVRAMRIAHWVSSALFVVAYAIHLVWRRARAA